MIRYVVVLLLLLLPPPAIGDDDACANISAVFKDGLASAELAACMCYMSHDEVWIVCERQNLFPIVSLMRKLPPDTYIDRLYIWDSAIPKMPAVLLTNVRPRTIKIESSTLRQLDGAVFAPVAETLQELDLKKNNVRRLDNVTLPALVHLDLKSNNVSHIENGAFDHLPALRILSLESNGVDTIDPGALARLTSLTTLSLSSNNLTSIGARTFAGLGSLEKLDLAENAISHVDADAFEQTPNLKRLFLGKNRLRRLVVTSASELTTLRLNGNVFASLADIDIDAPNLEVLQLDDNDVTSLTRSDLRRFPRLRSLSINNNRIASIDADAFQDLAELRTLFLANNQLQSMPDRLFASSARLENLDLSNNSLSSVSAHLLDGLSRLAQLTLCGNEISSIEADAFESTPGLVKLFIDGNRLTSLPEHLFDPLERLTSLGLDGNEWECSCQVEWLSRWLFERTHLLVSTHAVCNDDQPLALLHRLIDASNVTCAVRQARSPEELGDGGMVASVLVLALAGAILLLWAIVAGLCVLEYRAVYGLRRAASDTVHLLRGARHD